MNFAGAYELLYEKGLIYHHLRQAFIIDDWRAYGKGDEGGIFGCGHHHFGSCPCEIELRCYKGMKI